VVIIGGSYISVIVNIHKVPKALEGFNYFVNIFLGSHTLFGSFLLNFKTMLVSTRKKHYIIALHSSVTSDRVASNSCIAMSDMRIA